MKKTILTIVLAMLCLFSAKTQTTSFSGKVTDEHGKPLHGVTINLKGSKRGTTTDKEGTFILKNINSSQILLLSYIGYHTREIRAGLTTTITLYPDENKLDEVAILSTGYQNLPKERATGSFTQIEQKTLNRNVGINILDRLEGVASGLSLNRGLPSTPNSSKLSIHGRSTLFSNAEPLIVLDGFPYEGTIEQINPADISSITLLKDAAASSIWGAKSGNGVIVISTKKGSRNQPLSINASSTMTLSAKPDLYYIPQMSSSDYIDLEQFLFSKGFYNSRFSNPYNPVSGAVEIFNQRKNNQISAADSAARINELKGYDVREDLDNYFYRQAVYQQYQLNISGGSANHRYYISGGYDRDVENKVPDQYQRITLNASNTFSLIKDKLEISADVNFVADQPQTNTNNYNPYTPYDHTADQQGNALPVVTSTTLRKSYADTAGNGKLLDWYYRPKDELGANNIQHRNQHRIKTGFNYKILDGLSLSAYYQYLKESSDGNTNSDISRYSVRDMINKFSSISGASINRVIPIGNTLSQRKLDMNSHILRTQLSYSKTMAAGHEINLIAGYEGKDSRTEVNNQTYYGYDPETMASANASINPAARYPLYYRPVQTSQIQTAPDQSGIINIDQSYYANGSYAYQSRYILSGSIRRDESNLFGVKTNQKGVPLWSAGLAWNLHNEAYYHLSALPVLKFRLSYGYNGNLDKSTSAYLALLLLSNNEWGSPYSIVLNPPNPALRWERVKTWNIGLDFASSANRISGSIDLYKKDATDLIGNSPIAFQSGIEQYRGNSADLQTRGLDLVLNSRNLTGRIAWTSSLLFNYNTDKVTDYQVKQSSNQNIVSGNFNNPLVGYPYLSTFSYPSAGLDATGMPQGYLNGAVSKDYSKITGTLDLGLIKYHGPAAPKYFGSLINSFSYQNFELSFNVTYKLGYYFRRNNVFNGVNYGTSASTQFKLADYDKRWQKPGDELITRIPALSYPVNSARSAFSQYSSDLVEKGDHIRLQDIRLSYQLTKENTRKLPFKSASIFLYVRNLGLIWKATETSIDPDFGSSQIPLSLSGSLGINLNF